MIIEFMLIANPFTKLYFPHNFLSLGFSQEREFSKRFLGFIETRGCQGFIGKV